MPLPDSLLCRSTSSSREHPTDLDVNERPQPELLAPVIVANSEAGGQDAQVGAVQICDDVPRWPVCVAHRSSPPAHQHLDIADAPGLGECGVVERQSSN